MKDREYSKKEIALYELEMAIKIFLKGNDYISCITLAGASEEITGRMVERKGEKHILEMLKDYYKNDPDIDTSDGFYRWARSTRNALKHFNDPNEEFVLVTKLEACAYIQCAIYNYLKSGGIYTKIINDYMNWYGQEIKNKH